MNNTQDTKRTNKFKVEAKGSLWEVTLENGAYSSWDIEHYIFSGNSQDEVWEFVKIWADNGGIDKGSPCCGLVYGDERHQFSILPDYGEEVDWDTCYGDAYKVEITRAHVIYVNP